MQPQIQYAPVGGEHSRSADEGVETGSGDRPTRRAIALLGVLAIVGIVQIGFLLFVELDRTLRHRSAIAILEDELREARTEADTLRAVAERSADETFREQLARGQGFLHPDETRVVVVQEALPER